MTKVKIGGGHGVEISKSAKPEGDGKCEINLRIVFAKDALSPEEERSLYHGIAMIFMAVSTEDQMEKYVAQMNTVLASKELTK